MENREQSLIDHEVRLSRTQEILRLSNDARERRRDGRSVSAEDAWFRDQLIAMLKEAETEAELNELGLSDEVVREARLGDSVVQAWTRQRPPPPAGGLDRNARQAPGIRSSPPGRGLTRTRGHPGPFGEHHPH